MGGEIHAQGNATAPGGTTPFTWCNADNQNLTVGECEGVTVDVETGVFTVNSGYKGLWFFIFTFSVRGTDGAIQEYQLVGDPLGTPQVGFCSQRKLNTGSDIGNVTISGTVRANVGDQFAFRMVGDAAGEFLCASMSAFKIRQ